MGINPTIPSHPGEFQDLTGLDDLQNNFERVGEVQDYFDSLPSSTRLEFDNDVFSFIGAVLNPANKTRLQDLGILEKDHELLENNFNGSATDAPQTDPASGGQNRQEVNNVDPSSVG